MAALKENIRAMEYASERLRSNQEFVLKALKLDTDTSGYETILQYVSEKLMKDKKFLIDALLIHGKLHDSSISKEIEKVSLLK